MIVPCRHLALILVLVLAGSGQAFPEASARPDFYNAPTVDLLPPEDPLALPYRFHIVQDNEGRRENRVRFKRAYFPYLVSPPATFGLIGINNNWIAGDSLSAIIFHRDISSGQIVSHDNRPALQIDSYWPANFDSDPMDELAVTYVHNDSVWLTIVDPLQQGVDSQVIMIGQDRDGNKYWDGIAYIVGTRDLTADGIPEVFVATDVGYDLYDRMIMAVDVERDSILWQFRYTGAPDRNVQFAETKPSRFGLAGIRRLLKRQSCRTVRRHG